LRQNAPTIPSGDASHTRPGSLVYVKLWGIGNEQAPESPGERFVRDLTPRARKWLWLGDKLLKHSQTIEPQRQKMKWRFWRRAA
jgi:hypothetical protein